MPNPLPRLLTAQRPFIQAMIEWVLPFPTDNVAVGLTAGGIYFRTTVPRDLTLRTWIHTVRVNTTNNSTNYWTITLQKGTTPTNVDSFNTSTFTAGAWTRNENKQTAAIVIADLLLHIRIDKTGAPGTIDLAAPWLTFA